MLVYFLLLKISYIILKHYYSLLDEDFPSRVKFIKDEDKNVTQDRWAVYLESFPSITQSDINTNAS